MRAPGWKPWCLMLLLLGIAAPAVRAWVVLAGQRDAGNYTYPWNPAVDYNEWQGQNRLSLDDGVAFDYSSDEAVYSFPSRDALLACDFTSARLLCNSTSGTDKACVIKAASDAKFISSVESHCQAGQRLVIEASLSSLAGAGTASLRKLPSRKDRRRRKPKLPRGNPLDFVVGGSSGMGPPPVVRPTQSGSYNGRVITAGNPTGSFQYAFNPAVNYATWSQNTKFYVGDAISFRYPMYVEQVVRFNTWTAFRSCSYNEATVVCYDVWGNFKRGCVVKVENATAYYGSGLFSRCKAGVKFVVKPKVQPYMARKIVVGEARPEFAWPWNPVVNMQQWATTNKIYKGDILVFKYPKNADSVYQVPTQQDFQTCNYKNFLAFCGPLDGVGPGCESNPINTVSYFISGTFGHCKNGHKVVARPLPPI